MHAACTDGGIAVAIGGFVITMYVNDACVPTLVNTVALNKYVPSGYTVTSCALGCHQEHGTTSTTARQRNLTSPERFPFQTKTKF